MQALLQRLLQVRTGDPFATARGPVWGGLWDFKSPPFGTRPGGAFHLPNSTPHSPPTFSTTFPKNCLTRMHKRGFIHHTQDHTQDHKDPYSWPFSCSPYPTVRGIRPGDCVSEHEGGTGCHIHMISVLLLSVEEDLPGKYFVSVAVSC